MEKQMDPRTLRTRKLIMDAFIELSHKKDFKDITISDITTAATVNRATFYNHFLDKYELLEKILSENMMREVLQEVSAHAVINEETIKSVFLSITKLQKSISSQCKRSYESFTPQIEAIFKRELQSLFSQWGKEQWPDKTKSEIDTFSVMLSWALYGASTHWMQNQNIPLEEYAEHILHFIGVDQVLSLS